MSEYTVEAVRRIEAYLISGLLNVHGVVGQNFDGSYDALTVEVVNETYT